MVAAATIAERSFQGRSARHSTEGPDLPPSWNCCNTPCATALNIDLREDAPDYFKALPTEHLEGHYPAPFPTPENDFRIPVYIRDGEPDLNDAALSRAAEFAMVAYDSNALENQYLQGWLMQGSAS